MIQAPRNFFKDDSAQAMVVGVLSMFFILPTVALVYNVSQLVNQRIAVQQAADAAAYSGALAEANLLSSIAVTNEAMAYTYYGLMRQVVDVIVTGVLAEFEERGAPPDVVGIPEAVQRYDEAYSRAREWVPRGERWIEVLSKMERGMAQATPPLLLKEIAQAAKTNGAVAACVFPKPEYLPDLGFHLFYYIEKLNNGWRITNNSGYLLEFLELAQRKWQITSSGVGTILFEQLGDEHWRITTGHYVADFHTDALTYLQLDLTDSSGKTTHVESKLLFGSSWEFILKTPSYGLHVLPYVDGTYQITVSSASGSYSEHVKWDSNNRLMVNRNGTWTYLLDQPGQVTIGGVTINVSYIRSITFPGGAFWPPDFITFREIVFRPPNRLILPEVNIHIAPGLVTLYGQHELVHYRISNHIYFDVNGLTLRDADGRWRYINDRLRHRMIQDSQVHWTYELQKDPSDLVEEDPYRLGYHAVMDNDPQAHGPAGYALPEWTKWFRIGMGNAASPQAYHQTRTCWNPACDHVTYSLSSLACGVCHGFDHDWNGVTDVRVYQEDTDYRNYPTYQSVDILRFSAPLRISESFWKFGINVGAWMPGKRPLLGHKTAGATNTGNSLFPSFVQSPGGLFATASARVGFLYQHASPSGAIQKELLFNFKTQEEALRWSQAGYQCLYEPGWTAKLVPTQEAVRSLDIDAITPDSGTSFLFRSFKSARWYEVESPVHFGFGIAPFRADVQAAFKILRNREGRLLDTESPEFENILDH